MDIKDKKRIQRNYEALVDEMSVVLDDVVDYCLTKEILNIEMKSDIMQCASAVEKKKKCRVFVDMFLETNKLLREDVAFRVLCEALDQCHSSHIKNMLLETDVDDVSTSEDMDMMEDGDQCEEESFTDGAAGACGDSKTPTQTTVINISGSSNFHIGDKTTYNISYGQKSKSRENK